jgi:putative restriction endonuclease
MANTLWTKDQIKLAFHLYCQLPFGRIHGRNPEIISLAKVIGRTADAVAMKMCNIASLDPAIRSTGRIGLGNASALDRSVWEEFHSDWERLAEECQSLIQDYGLGLETAFFEKEEYVINPEEFVGDTKLVLTKQRVKQRFFRRAVLSSYSSKCCMSGLTDERLLIASHIVPWSSDKANRLNPSNGLCLSAIHDRAFDKGLISLTDDARIILSIAITNRDDDFIKTVFLPLENQKIKMPERFQPSCEFLTHHRTHIFLDSLK